MNSIVCISYVKCDRCGTQAELGKTYRAASVWGVHHEAPDGWINVRIDGLAGDDKWKNVDYCPTCASTESMRSARQVLGLSDPETPKQA